MTRRGRCFNYAGCMIAYRNELVDVTEGDFICPECKKPLVPAPHDGPIPVKKMPIIVGLGILALLLCVVISMWISGSRVDPADTLAGAPRGVPPPPREEPASTPAAPLTTGVKPEPVASSPPDAPAPAAETPASPAGAPQAVKQDLDPARPENRTVKAEVLKRIDLMPRISPENKDKLYLSVEKARQMGRVISIPFASGSITLSPTDTTALQGELQHPEVQKLLQDPTAVFVILGFADVKGNEQSNLRISEARADTVLDTLKTKCGVFNVMHAVGMGGVTLFDEKGAEKNRIAEVWAVLP